MIHILHGFSNVDSEFKPRNLRQEVHYIESPRTKTVSYTHLTLPTKA